jgi:hypothetical protein
MNDKYEFPVGSLAHLSPIYEGSAISIYNKVPGTGRGMTRDVGEITTNHICLIIDNELLKKYSRWRKVLAGGMIGWISTLDLAVLHEAR